jgi:dihydrolipoamide dehydrogenase
MSQTIEVRIPDIGDFAEVEVIELLVKPGDTVTAEQSLITVESDKASMEIPSSAAGVVKELKVALGDKVAEGSLVLVLEAATGAAAAPAAGAAASPDPVARASVTAPPPTDALPAAPRPPAAIAAAAAAAAPRSGPQPAPPPGREPDQHCQLLVIGGGPGGYSAAFRAADLGLNTVIIERYPVLGGVCLNVGCIPSKALLHVASLMDEARALAAHGIAFGEPRIDLAGLRGWKDQVVGKLTGGLAGMARARKVAVVRGVASFVDAHHVEVELTEGEGQARAGTRRLIRFEQAIIAVGSQPVRLPFLPEDPRIVDSTGALGLSTRPRRMLVIGGGIIGLEMGTVYSTLGAQLDVVEMQEGLMTGADRDLVKVWQKFNQHRFGRLMMRTRTVRAEAESEGIRVWFEGDNAPPEPQCYDLVLSAVGRTPNGGRIAAERAGVSVDARGFIAVDSQMRTSAPHIFAIGDVVGQPMLAHKAVHEGHVAAEAAAGRKSHFDASVIPSVAYTDPEVAWVGLTEDEAKTRGIEITRGLFPWAASGRAIANGRDEGFTKLLFDAQTHRIVGGGIVGTHAGDLIGEIALAIEMGADAVDIGRTIHPHPTLGESIGLAAEAAEGVCTDLPPPRKR